MLREKEKKQRVAEKNGHELPEKTIRGLNGYRPSDKEPFMGERQRAFSRGLNVCAQCRLVRREDDHARSSS